MLLSPSTSIISNQSLTWYLNMGSVPCMIGLRALWQTYSSAFFQLGCYQYYGNLEGSCSTRCTGWLLSSSLPQQTYTVYLFFSQAWRHSCHSIQPDINMVLFGAQNALPLRYIPLDASIAFNWPIGPETAILAKLCIERNNLRGWPVQGTPHHCATSPTLISISPR